MSGEIINKVAESGIVTLDLKNYYPTKEVLAFDLKPFLFMEMILKEKDFRAALQATDWSIYEGKIVAVFCSVDTLIPNWAYMLIASYLTNANAAFLVGTVQDAINFYLLKELREQLVPQDFIDKRVVIKGCGDIDIPAAGFGAITQLLLPFVKSLMYGEPCSTVPVYKKKA